MTNVIARLFSRPRQGEAGFVAPLARPAERLHMDVQSGRQAAGTLTRDVFFKPPREKQAAGFSVRAFTKSARSASRVSRIHRIVAAALLLSICASASAQQPSRTTRKEITHLFEHLERSGCQFFRNGSWHDSKKAAAHLQKKYIYLLAKELVPTSEAFIDRAATRSSLSGKPYQVRCAGQVEIDSAIWFTTELARWRKPMRSKATPASGDA